MKDLENFTTDVLENKGLTVVKFFATWCGPCKMLIPVLERVEIANPNVTFIQVDTDLHNQLAVDHQLKSVPTVLFFKDGQEISRVEGLRLTSKYQEVIDNV